MKPYSEALRWRVVRAVDGEMSRREAAVVFEVSLPTIKRWVKRRRETGDLAPTPIPGPPAIKRAALLEALPARLVEHADATLGEHCSWWHERSGVAVSTATMSRAITALAWTRKKTRTANSA
jgi:transposase